MEKTYSYYMIHRPPMPGAMPKQGLVEIHDLDVRKPIWRIGGRGAYGRVVYDRELSESEVWNYELTPVPKDFHDLAKEMEAGSWYTIIGAGGDLDEWKNGYQRLLKQEGIGKITRWEKFFGWEMNEEYHLSGDNRYEGHLTFLAFPLNDLDLEKLAIFKLKMDDHWFDDIVANNRMREEMVK